MCEKFKFEIKSRSVYIDLSDFSSPSRFYQRALSETSVVFTTCSVHPLLLGYCAVMCLFLTFSAFPGPYAIFSRRRCLFLPSVLPSPQSDVEAGEAEKHSARERETEITFDWRSRAFNRLACVCTYTSHEGSVGLYPTPPTRAQPRWSRVFPPDFPPVVYERCSRSPR